jgi:hypothetical protein
LKAAEATLRLERERAAREKLEGRLGPRKLSGASKHKIAVRLAMHAPLKIDLNAQPDLEVRSYADGFAGALRAGGAQVNYTAVRFFNTDAHHSIKVSTKVGGRGELLCEVFREEGVHFGHTTHVDEPDPDGFAGLMDRSSDLIIQVNEKPPHI